MPRPLVPLGGHVPRQDSTAQVARFDLQYVIIENTTTDYPRIVLALVESRTKILFMFPKVSPSYVRHLDVPIRELLLKLDKPPSKRDLLLNLLVSERNGKHQGILHVGVDDHLIPPRMRGDIHAVHVPVTGKHDVGHLDTPFRYFCVTILLIPCNLEHVTHVDVGHHRALFWHPDLVWHISNVTK